MIASASDSPARMLSRYRRQPLVEQEGGDLLPIDRRSRHKVHVRFGLVLHLRLPLAHS